MKWILVSKDREASILAREVTSKASAIPAASSKLPVDLRELILPLLPIPPGRARRGTSDADSIGPLPPSVPSTREFLPYSESQENINRDLFASKFFTIPEVLKDVDGQSRYSEYFETALSNEMYNIPVVYNLKDSQSGERDDKSSTSGEKEHQSSLNDPFNFLDPNRLVDRVYDYTIPFLISVPKPKKFAVQSKPTNVRKNVHHDIDLSETPVLIIISTRPNWLRKLESYIESQGHNVMICTNAEDGLELMKWTKFSVAFIDVTMVRSSMMIYE